MSLEVMRHVWKHSPSKGNARLMLLAIADIANDTGDAYPGVDRLASKCNVSDRCAQDVIHELERSRELLVYENVGTKTKSGWTNLYRIFLEGVDQPEVRKPTGEIAEPRQVSEKKTRKFPKGVQLASPLEGVQPVSPDEVKIASPDGVQLASPNSLVYPSDYPSVNTNTKDTAPDGADASKPLEVLSFPKTKPVNVNRWNDKQIAAYFDDHTEDMNAISKSRGIDPKYVPFKSWLVSEQKRTIKIAVMLCERQINLRDYIAFLMDMFKWRKPCELNFTDYENNVAKYQSKKAISAPDTQTIVAPPMSPEELAKHPKSYAEQQALLMRKDIA